MYEDDGETNDYQNGAVSKTEFSISENGNTLCVTSIGTKTAAYLPKKKSYSLFLRDVVSALEIHCTADGEPVSAKMEATDKCLIITLPQLPIEAKIEVTICGVSVFQNPSYKDEILRIFTKYNGSNIKKMPFIKDLRQ